MKAQRNEGGRRILLGDNRRRGGHAAAEQVPVCCNSDFKRTAIYIYIYIYIGLYMFSSDCSKIRLGLDHPERNYCIGQGCLNVEMTDLWVLWYLQRIPNFPREYTKTACLLTAEPPRFAPSSAGLTGSEFTSTTRHNL